jgi:glycosyltransferase involved in cell wall biosynthesis
MAAAQLGPITGDLAWERTEKWFDRLVARNHLPGSAAVYGFEHACLESFLEQKKRNGLCIYEMPITHHRTTSELLDPEFESLPEIVTRCDRHLQRMAPRRNERKDHELQLADHVITYTTFAKRSLMKAGVPDSRISVIPLGAPPPDPPTVRATSPFIFLSAGTQSVRKGVHYLLQAWHKLAPKGDVELWLVGKMSLPQHLTRRLPGKVVVMNSVPQAELCAIYRRANALVFPSLCEGFGMVITEAMSKGLPVITTENTAGPDLIQHGRNGFLIPVRDVNRLEGTMQWCLDNRRQVQEIGQEGARTAARWQWSDYRLALADVVRDVLVGGCGKNISALAATN